MDQYFNSILVVLILLVALFAFGVQIGVLIEENFRLKHKIKKLESGE